MKLVLLAQFFVVGSAAGTLACSGQSPAASNDDAPSIRGPSASLLPAAESTDVTSDALTSPVHSAFATHFDGVGTPAGGCGVPAAEIGTADFVALNVQNTPHDYAPGLPRPIQDPTKIGEFDNGANCGRWVQVTIGDFCNGDNSGAPGSKLCPGGATPDQYNGATLNLIVTDSCQDANAWCRDDRYHLDLSTASLGHFEKNGSPVVGLANKWNNRKISWKYIPAPSYTGDIHIGFANAADPKFYLPIVITHLPNGIHSVERLVNGAWQKAPMNGDQGQAYRLPPGPGPYTIRVRDVNDQLIFGGRTYQFEFPKSCGEKCSAAYTRVH